MKDRAQWIINECCLLATMTEEPGRTTRRFLTPPVHDVHAHLRQHMIALGMDVRVDAVGNMRGLWTATNGGSRRLILGSHIDTVPDAGAFDGVLGVVMALEWVRLAREDSLALPIEVIAFSDEEGVRFEVPFLGSRAAAGIFDQSLLALEDKNGIRMDDSIRFFGLDPLTISECVVDPSARGFVEIHIEQGPVLESEQLHLAVVFAIAGQTRVNLRFTGQSNHAGTTPMHSRHDALAAAAEWISTVESSVAQAAASDTPGLVATVGKIATQPNAGNVIPGVVDASLDVRHPSNHIRKSWTTQLVNDARVAAQKRGVVMESAETLNEAAVEMDPYLSLDLKLAVEAEGIPVKTIVSGAGHDAMVMARRLPSAMLFLRSPGGISHHPAETVLVEDVEAALRVGRRFLAGLAKQSQ